MKKTVLLVGCGNMGFAMLEGWMKARPDIDFCVVEPARALRERAAGLGAMVFETAQSLSDARDPDIIFLAVKPQVMGSVVPAYARFGGGTTTFVSVAAGIKIARLADCLPGPTPIVRTMPNTPAAVGKGMMVSVANEPVTSETRALVDDLLAASGETAWIDREDLMDAVTAISGSGPAYFFHVIECLAAAGTKLGLPPELAMTLARQTALGAAHLAVQSGTSPTTLREQVTSPGGTTAAALAVLMGDDALGRLMDSAARAARDRGIELGRDDAQK